MKKYFWVLAILLMAATAAWAAKTFTRPPAPENLNRGLTKKDAAYNPQPGKGYMEAWDFWAKGPGKSIVIAEYLVSNMGIQNSFPGYNVTVITPSGKRVVAFQEFKAEAFRGDKNALDVSFTNATISGAHPHYRATLSDPKLSYDLKFTSECPGFKPDQDGKYKFQNGDSSFYQVKILAPRAKVSGTVNVEGEEFSFNGWGYADHMTQTKITPTFSNSWTSLRFHGEQISLMHFGFVPTKDYGGGYIGQTLMVNQNKITHFTDKAMIASSRTMLDPKTKDPVPKDLKIIVDESDWSLEMAMNLDKPYDRMGVLERLNPVTKKILGLFVTPNFYRYFGTATLSANFGEGTKEYPGQVMTQLIFLKN